MQYGIGTNSEKRLPYITLHMKTVLSLLLLIASITSTATPFSTPQPVVSSWQSMGAWQRRAAKDAVSFSGALPQVRTGEKGVTLVFVKGYNCSALSMPEKPLSLPFLFWGDEDTAYEWKVTEAGGGRFLETRMLPACEAAYVAKQKDILYRQIYFDEQFLKEKGVTAAQLRKLSYKQLAELTGITD